MKQIVLNSLYSIAILISLVGCSTDGTITAFHPKKPIYVDFDNCPEQTSHSVTVVDLAIPPNYLLVGEGTTSGSVHGENVLQEAPSETFKRKLNCLASENLEAYQKIKKITINKLSVNYKNILVSWQTNCNLDITVEFTDGNIKEFSSLQKSPALTFTITKNMAKVYELAIDECFQKMAL